jgi:DNA-binding NarL/FixJ family response regulator
MKPIRILIVDDHSIFRQGLRSILENETDFELVGEARDGCMAINLAMEAKPDMILMDINMPNCNGLEATREILKRQGNIRVIMLTISEAEEDLFEAVRSGARGYLEKDVDAIDLINALRRAMKGEALLSGMLAAKILEEFKGEGEKTTEAQTDQLTARESEVLKLVSSGMSNRDIAEALVVSENTVKHHLSNILEKLHLKSRLQLAVYSLQTGIASSKEDSEDRR